MSPIAVSVIVSLAGVLLSVLTAVFIAGSWKGKMETTINDMSRRLANIEGMFKLTLKE